MPAAPRVVAESVAWGLVGGRLFGGLFLGLLLGGGLLGGDLFSRGLFGGRLLGSSLFGGGLLGGVFLGLLLGGDLFGCGLFRGSFSAAALSAAWRSCSRRFFPSARPACALPPGAPFPWRPRRLRVPFPLPHASSWLAAARSQGRLPTWAAGPWVRAEARGSGCFCGSGSGCGRLRLGFGRFGRGRRRNGRIAVRPELHFHRAGRFRAPVQVEDQHGQQQRVPTRPEAGLSGCQCWAAWPGPLRCRMMGGVMGVACRRAGGRASR